MSEGPSAVRTAASSGTSDYANAEGKLLGSILRGEQGVANRATLGNKVPIQLFQVLRLIALGSSLEEMLGGGARALVYQSGQRLGATLGKALLPQAGSDLKKYLTLVREILQKLSVGVLVAEKLDSAEGRLVLRVDECVSCAGITQASGPICHFETGMVGGLVKVFVGKDARAVETRCNAVGDRTCGVDVQILG